MPTAYVNIGSNQGDRRANIARAIALIEQMDGVTHLRRSDSIESEPWGFGSDSTFINIGLSFTTDTEPEELLKRLLLVEKSISPLSHRDAAGNYVDRIIDIDLIAVDDTIIDTPVLTLPHPRMHLRRFVLQPMAQLAPTWRHPLLGLTPQQLLDLNI